MKDILMNQDVIQLTLTTLALYLLKIRLTTISLTKKFSTNKFKISTTFSRQNYSLFQKCIISVILISSNKFQTILKHKLKSKFLRKEEYLMPFNKTLRSSKTTRLRFRTALKMLKS